MFCYQRSFGLPTEVVTLEQFRALISAPRTFSLVKEAREALEKGDKAAYDKNKKQLPFVIFIATYDEWDKEFENKKTHEKTTKRGCWRSQQHCRLNGLCVIDYDHIEGDVRKVWEEAFNRLSEEDQKKILFVFVTPSGHGLKVVFMADPAIGNLIDNQIVFSLKMGLNPDESCKDASRGAFLTTSEDVIFIDEEQLINYENEEFGKKYNESYHAGHSQPTIDIDKARADYHGDSSVQTAGEDQPAVSGGHGEDPRDAEPVMYGDVPIAKIIEAWMEGRNLTNHRHDTLVELSDHLRYLIGKNPTKITEVVMTLPWVKDLAAEGEDVEGTVSSIMGWRYRQKKPDALLEALKKVQMSSRLSEAHGEISGDEKRFLDSARNDNSAGEDIYASLPLDKWAEELQEMAKHYPCMKELFANVHPHKLAAVCRRWRSIILA